MLTRRTFLAASAATLPAAAASIPEPITALRDRHGEAAPITADERLSRMERARALMATNHMGAVFLAGGTSLTYFSGIRWYNSERLFVMLLPSRGDPLFICPAFEEGRVREQLAQHANLRGAGVFSWQEDDDPYTLAASCLKERGLASARIGFEERMPFVFTAGIAAAATAATFTSATPVTAGCRMIKSPAELALMKLASSVTWHV